MLLKPLKDVVITDVSSHFNQHISLYHYIFKSSICNYSDAYMLVIRTITVAEQGNNDTKSRKDKKDKGVIFQNYVFFTDCISENTKTDHAKNLDMVMPIYNLTEYSDDHSKANGSYLQFYRDVPKDTIRDSKLFKFNLTIIGKALHDGNAKMVEIVVSFKYLSNDLKTLKMPKQISY